MSIRRADPLEAERLAGVHAECFPDAWDVVAIHELLESPGVFGFIDDTGNGFVIVRVAADEAEILTLAVTGAARRRGLGRALLDAAMHAAANTGARRLFLEAAETNAAARALYAGAGFEETGRRKRYYPDGADALLLSRNPG
jgi:ribosomal-protein-alanine N-acetyltransferase